MKVLSQEHYQLMAQFERSHSGRFDREDKSLWPKGIIYQDGRVNEMFLAYRNGYAFCEADMRSDLQNLEASRDGYRADAERNAKDAERLDFLADQDAQIESLRFVKVTKYRIRWPDLDEEQSEWFGSPREAIDTAIAAQQGKGGGGV